MKRSGKKKKQKTHDRTFENLRQQMDGSEKLSFQVATDSMQPLIQPGDVIEARKPGGSFERYDIIVFRQKQILICHFVWHLNRLPMADGTPCLITRSLRGGEDLPVPITEILGVVTSHQIGSLTRLRLSLKHALTRILK